MKTKSKLIIKAGRWYVTADGDAAYILKDDARGTHPIFGYIKGRAHDFNKSWTREGIFDVNTASNNTCALVAEMGDPLIEKAASSVARHWAGDLDHEKNDRIPFDNYADIKANGMFFVRRPTWPHTGAGEEAVLYSVRRIDATGINSYTWKELFKNNFEYSESMAGPWLKFVKYK